MPSPNDDVGDVRGVSQASESTEDEKTSQFNSDKTRSILDACERRDLAHLRQLAISPGGFLTDSNRCQAWPILLGDDLNSTEPVRDSGHESETWSQLPRHRDEDQVKLDVDRSFVYYPNDNSPSELLKKKSELSDLITEVLRRQPWLCYFQGYHDICQVFLLVLPGPLRASAVARLSGLRIRDFMLPNLTPTMAQLLLIPDILGAFDRPLWELLSRTEPYFALSDTLTMFAHNIQRYSDIARLYDALLAHEQVFSIYILVQIVLLRREELFEQDEPDMLHFTLSKLPQELDLDSVIRDAAGLFAKRPPQSLRAWRSISNASVLKTTRGERTCVDQTLDDGRVFFEKQLHELNWAQWLDGLRKYDTWQNRAAVATVVVGLAAAVWSRKGGSSGFTALAQWVSAAAGSHV